MACSCYVWPLAAVGRTGTCGRCGAVPDLRVLIPPKDGKARPRWGWDKIEGATR